jgi:RimJ/RimL family protein N-acetyltransferase
MILETERLIIRPIHIDDAREVFLYRSDVEANKYQGWIPESPNDVKKFIAKVSAQINEPETWFQFVLIHKQSKKLIGDIGVHFFGSENAQAELGCTLNKKFYSHGFAQESLRKVIGYLFVELNKHRIITSIDPENTPSIRLVERIGFRKEAHFIESIFIRGKWVDDIVYAMTKKDWEKIGL